MKEKKDQFEQFIADNFEKLAKQEEEKLEQDDNIQMPEGARESIRARLDDEIKKMEEKETYANLSEEDRRALELGRRMIREGKDPEEPEQEEDSARKPGSRKKKIRVWLILAAVLILGLAIGITSLGGPERVIQMLTQNVGEREVEQVVSSEDSIVTVEENEEEAYQIASNEFGVELVRITVSPINMQFNNMTFDKLMPSAEMIYTINSENIIYLITTSYTESSLGLDVEDKIINKYNVDNGNLNIVVTEYELDNGKSRFMARFSNSGLEYFLIGEMSQKEFEDILQGLYFSM